MNKTYLGDAVYVSYDGFGFELVTFNGITVTNTIYLEPVVYLALVAYVERLKKA